MKASVGLISSMVLFLLIGTVFSQRPRPKKPTRRPPTTRKPPVRKPVTPAATEPQEPTDFPPPILGPPSSFADCPRECSCNPSYPNALYCENRNLRVVPVIPFRTHYLYLQNNYISEVTAEAFNNATEVRWINLANNRIQRIDKQVRKFISNKTQDLKKNTQNYCSISIGTYLFHRYLRRSQHCCICTCNETSSKRSHQASQQHWNKFVWIGISFLRSLPEPSTKWRI